jgi:CRP/FNR family transcriptional regulator, cyclic AMP receptor protein
MSSNRGESLRTFLRGVPVFGGLEGRSLESVIDVLDDQTFAAGGTIFSEGELGRSMYVLRKGEVEVLRTSASGKKVPIVRLGPGECFGEMALVELQPRSATIVVKKKAETFSLTNFDLYKLYREDNYAYVIVLQNICRLLSRRLRKADSRIADFVDGARTAVRQRARKR